MNKSRITASVGRACRSATAVGVLAAALAGCQTSLDVIKHAEVASPIEKVVQVNGQDRVITDGYLISSGGWEATARSPLYAVEALDGLGIEVTTNGTVRLNLNRYARDLSTNSVAMVGTMFRGGADLATAIGDAYVRIAGGGAQAAAVMDVARKVYGAFSSGGGDPSKATVTTDGDAIRVSDGSVCTTCTPDGTCSTGACSE